MERKAFEQLVAEGYNQLPEKFRKKIRNVALLVEDEPSDEVRRDRGLEEGESLLGLYTGIPVSERGDFYGVGPTLPDTVIIYQKPTEEAARGDPVRIRDIVRDTVWHEFAHYFGMDEDEVEARERERGIDL
jgi:predicted Zn-dependent protease with MMP-like domain